MNTTQFANFQLPQIGSWQWIPDPSTVGGQAIAGTQHAASNVAGSTWGSIWADLQSGPGSLSSTILIGLLGVLLIVAGVWALVGDQTTEIVTTAAKAGAAA